MKRTVVIIAEIETDDYPDWKNDLVKYLPDIAAKSYTNKRLDYFITHSDLDFEEALRYFRDSRDLEHILDHWPDPDEDE